MIRFIERMILRAITPDPVEARIEDARAKAKADYDSAKARRHTQGMRRARVALAALEEEALRMGS